jgi:hypothetical protein
MIGAAIWRSRRFLALDSDGRVLLHYFLSGPHSTSAGCFRLPVAYGVADLRWTEPQYRAAFEALVDAGLIEFDSDTDEIYVMGWFAHCPPTNIKHALGIKSLIERIESDAVRERAEADFAATEWGGKLLNNDNGNPLDTRARSLVETDYMNGRRRPFPDRG